MEDEAGPVVVFSRLLETDVQESGTVELPVSGLMRQGVHTGYNLSV